MDTNRVQQCTNCGLFGHVFRNCLSPVTSYGIIAIKYTNNDHIESLYKRLNNVNNGKENVEFLLIQRKDSLAFVEFIRGKYNPLDEEYLGRLLRGMTKREQSLLLENSFSDLWRGVWGDSSPAKSHKSDYDISEKKFGQIQSKLSEIVEKYTTKWDYPEWGFPKGRRNPHESDMNCAIREFQEETGLQRNQFTILQNSLPISETFFGSNQVHYCHKYYIAVCNNEIDVQMNMENPHMAREIGNIEWCNLDEAMVRIRPDNVEKREILLKAAKIIRNFHPVSVADVYRINYKHK
jgi:8-oxo-dGTP pyrophosphatase MutT (NUDIX family)